ncbi:MAG: hypothetical protein FWD58_06270 [Firmicutes bacterium]|nr:hypothetical protein [Bacillota bacterium]
MANKITLSDDDINGVLAKIKEQLLGRKIGKDIEFRFSPGKDERRATIFFTPCAWVKAHGLVKEFSGEVQWHGTVRRLSENSFVVEDILIFPHEATEASVISDQVEYQDWLNALPDDVFNQLRFHGHSHVRMRVFPSPVDDNYRKNILNNFGKPAAGDDLFYIFLIANKHGDLSGMIYDVTHNAVYDTEDIDFEVCFSGGILLSEFIKEARAIVKEPRGMGRVATQSVPQKNKPENPVEAEDTDAYFEDEESWYRRQYPEFYRKGGE